MTKEQALMIQERINNGIHNKYKPTAVIAYIEEPIVNDYNDYRIDVRPDTKNEGNSFHHLKLITDIARGFDVNAYAEIRHETIHVTLY